MIVIINAQRHITFPSNQPDILHLSSLFVLNFQDLKMQQSIFIPSFILLYILIFFLQLETSFSVDIQYQNCRVPKTCGNQYISSPFYIPDQQEPYCDFPGFEVSCNEENGSPVLQLAGDDYLIHNISYHDQTLVVSNAALSNLRTAGCIPLFKNLSFPTDQYDLVPNQKELLLLYNCNSSLVDESFSMYKLSCFEANSSTSTTSVLALPGKLFANVLDKCASKVALALVLDYDPNNQWGSEEVLSRGFMLRWHSSNCSKCEHSGGKCGFDVNTYHSRCFSPDRPHAVRCIVKGKAFGWKIRIGLGTGAGGLVILVLAVLCYLRIKLSDKSTFFWMNKDQNRQIVEKFLENCGPLQVKRYSYLDVKKMTNSFKEKLGQGGYGGVYKGYLKDGCPIAVKILNRSKGNGEEFMNEVAAISRTSHVNIVSLLGFCFDI